ncbi:MAG: hypothetical protein HOB92_05535 [Candidatus Cloacimonetes bacterium]|jgi:hypothetical protein|nr:hypothetical protein [Candidatus Cloacimonadota bacterium]
MKRLLILLLLIGTSNIYSITLKEVYKTAPTQGEYDKYLALETGVTYTGGLLIGPIYDPIIDELSGPQGLNVRIEGNGAILDLEGEQICISFCNNKLDIDNCIIINGNIRYRGFNNEFGEVLPTGYVQYCTFYKPQDHAIRLQGTGGNITLERNIFVDAVDTGDDFTHLTGVPMEWLPTGSNVAISIFYATYGIPTLLDNWSYHSEEEINLDGTKHFVELCEYG